MERFDIMLARNEIVVAPLFGYQGCGKGTISEGLGRIFPYMIRTVAPGDLIRMAKRQGAASPHHPVLAPYYGDMEQGKLLPGEVLNLVLASEIQRAVTKEGARVVILDGFPRNMEQYKGLDNLVRAAVSDGHPVRVHGIELRVSRETAMARIAGRVSESGASARADDLDEAIVKRRLDTYEGQTLEVVAEMATQDRLTVICGERERREVFKAAFCALASPMIRRIS